MPEETWPRWVYDDARTGDARDNTGPVEEPEIAWVFEGDRQFEASPVVDRESIYIADGETLYALDRASGEARWSVDCGEEMAACAPTATDEFVYVVGGWGTLQALDRTSGACEWSCDVGTVGDISPAVLDGTLYVSGAEAPLYALDATDGSVQWENTEVDSLASPAIGNETVYLRTPDGQFACDADSGELVWSRAISGSGASTPAVVDNRVYTTGSDDICYALDADTGETCWSTDFSTMTSYNVLIAPLVVGNGHVYVGQNTGQVTALEATTGDRVWTTEFSEPTAGVGTASALTETGLYVVGLHDSRVYRTDPVNGEILWSVDVDPWPVSSPAVADGRVYVGGKDGVIALG